MEPIKKNTKETSTLNEDNSGETNMTCSSGTHGEPSTRTSTDINFRKTDDCSRYDINMNLHVLYL